MEMVVQFPRLWSRLELQRFLGLVNCWFLRGAAGFLLPLTDALQGPGKSLAWSPLMEQAFNAAKKALAAAAELEHPKADFPISLIVDGSGTHIGAVLRQHFRRSSWSPLSFFSKKLSLQRVRRGVVGCLLRHTPLLPDAGRPPVFRHHRQQASLPRLWPAFCSVVHPTAAAFGVHL